MAPKTKNSNPVDFVRKYLRRNPEAAYAPIRDAAAKQGITVHPISYGRAKVLEGLITAKPRGSSKAPSPTPKRGPGRPKGSKNKPKTGKPALSATDATEGLVSVIQQLQAERDDAVERLNKIRGLVAAAR